MAVSLLRRLAASHPAPVFVVAGRGPAERLRLDERVEVVASPRHATVLLVVGAIPADHAAALRRIHDQLPHPRAAAWWSGSPLDTTAREALPHVTEVSADPAGVVVDLHRGLLLGGRESSPALGPCENPTDWKGVGPHGQGGEGMMGGTPYGRPMAMTGDDVRDGLMLDRVPLTVGPYHASLPPGLTLELELQGDVIVSCAARGGGAPWLGAEPDVGWEADPGGSAWLADVLRIHGLGSRADRVLRTSGADRDRIVARARRALVPSLSGVGRVEGEDALERLDRRLAGEPLANDLAALDEVLVGMEWAEAVTTVWTLGLAPFGDRQVAQA